MTESATVPFTYRVRVNRRARRARISVEAHGEVVVVLPRALAEREIQQLVSQHQAWVCARLAELQTRLAQLPGQLGLQPQTIHLEAVGQHWVVEYGVLSGPRRWRERENPRRLQLRAGAEEAAAREALQGWLQQQAKQILSPWLQELAERLGLICTGVTVRAQKTRWGSCSASGRINLNRNLLFLPPSLVEYLLVHELCHLREPNHSPRYWQQVEKVLPDYRQRDRALRAAVDQVPLWARPGA
ncbi:MAG: SprT family zinc-dependent metalloprotease [Thiohalophilus sp.]|uniref:M48 family metallopeptidase n=1 Tax=Thiohalophilus sp. TaxID=3028392 RepID=UPI0028700CB9|nr:SprT family zinc-dependent metalloprotease [Thiohalophilus sp.]MDR9436371.1 SprT family zinc-dependent metalloprotease [Thiohalophilus sp.]